MRLHIICRETFKHTLYSTEKSREREARSRLERENKLRSEVSNGYTDAIKDCNHSMKMETKLFLFTAAGITLKTFSNLNRTKGQYYKFFKA